jgi:hypothetical protein
VRVAGVAWSARGWRGARYWRGGLRAAGVARALLATWRARLCVLAITRQKGGARDHFCAGS